VDKDNGGLLAADFRRLPVAVAEDLGGAVFVDGAVDFDEEGFRFGNGDIARKEVACECLQMTVAEEAARDEGWRELRDRHRRNRWRLGEE